MIMYSGPSHATSKQQDWFVSYEQGADQILQQYLRIKWDLFKQGWPDPLGRSTAFGIEDTISGLYHPTIKNAMYRARPPSMSVLELRAVQRVRAERINLIQGTAAHIMWKGLELENLPWTPYPINRRQGSASVWGKQEQPATANKLARGKMWTRVGTGPVTHPHQHHQDDVP